MEGYIKLFRKFIKWEWHDKPEMVSLFVHFLLLANHEDGKWQGNTIKKGQFITGLKSLKRDTGISTQTLRTCLSRLKSTGEITYQSTSKFRLISICNWEEYQSKPTTKSTIKLTNNQQATNNQLTSNKNVKNDKNEKNTTNVVQTSYGNEDINKVYDFLKSKLEGTPDGTIKDNRRFAKMLLDRMKKDYPDNPASEVVNRLIDIALKDDFHSKNATSFKYLYYHSQQIIQGAKNKINNVVKL